MQHLEQTIKRTLSEFGSFIIDNQWYGKEREAVSYYAFGFLANACAPGTLFYDPAQIVLETRLPSGPLNKKKEVCKDLGIWSQPGGNCWNTERMSVNYPLVLVEWKANNASFNKYDVAHVKSLTEQAPQMLGIIVTFDLHKKVFRGARVEGGVMTEGWLEVTAKEE